VRLAALVPEGVLFRFKQLDRFVLAQPGRLERRPHRL
jgi:hypothetical protein